MFLSLGKKWMNNIHRHLPHFGEVQLPVTQPQYMDFVQNHTEDTPTG